MSHPDDPRPWKQVGSEAGPDLIVCRARFDTLTNPRTGQDLKRLVLETPDWVNVVALTAERRLVVVRQYRFGTSSVTTEIPGGMVDPGEDSEQAGRRELREEAGYTAERWTYLGAVEPNPAIHDNLCHHWLAEDASQTHPLDQDLGEDLVATTFSAEEVRAALADGSMRHALVLTALARVIDLRGGAGDWG